MDKEIEIVTETGTETIYMDTEIEIVTETGT